MFRSLFQSYPDVELVPYDLTLGGFPEALGDCDGWLTTGSRHSVYDNEPWIGRFGNLVRSAAEQEQPFVGICFGHQMLAQVLGGAVRRSGRGWGVGLKEVGVNRIQGWMGGPVSTYMVLNSHADQIECLPAGAEVLGSNDHCPVSMLQIGDRLLGIQGHPEFSLAYSRALLESRRGSIIPTGDADAALASLELPPDTEMLADWIVAFLAT
jgi:GMP synthase-like glutamine amidotransferase